MKRAVFLDRDGVITVPSSINGKGFAPRAIQEFRYYEDVPRSLEKIRGLGFLSLIISNQPDVANGLLSIQVLEEMNQKILNELAIDDIRNCPHSAPENCSCRKPNPGMILDSALKWNVELDRSWTIGDRDSDIAAGAAVGCGTIFIDRGWVAETGELADFRCKSLETAVEILS